MREIVPLEVWYPAMAAKWSGTVVPRGDREAWIIHHTAGGTGLNPLSYARSVADYHYGKWGVPGGYNVLVGTDGVLRAMCGLDRQGVHSGTTYWNRHGLGLSFQGDFRTAPPSDVMLAAAAELVGSWPLPQKTHREVRPDPTTCPGDALIRLLPLEVEEDMAVKIPLETWAVDAFKWAVLNKVYTEKTNLDEIRESYEFQQLMVALWRVADRRKGHFPTDGTAGVSQAVFDAHRHDEGKTGTPI